MAGVRILGTVGISRNGANPRYVVVAARQIVAVVFSVDGDLRNLAGKEPRTSANCGRRLEACELELPTRRLTMVRHSWVRPST